MIADTDHRKRRDTIDQVEAVEPGHERTEVAEDVPA